MPKPDERFPAKDRQSRSGKDDSAKKGGKGGKYTWEGDGDEGPARVDKRDPNYDGPQDEVKDCKIVSVTKDQGAKVEVPDKDEPVDIPASDLYMVRWKSRNPMDTTFDIVKNPAFTEGKKVTVYHRNGKYTLHKAAKRRPRRPKTEGDRKPREPRGDRPPRAPRQE
eukprot:g3035.t1